MFSSRWHELAILIGIYYLISPLLVRSTFRFNAKCKPALVPLEQLPPAIAAVFRQRIPQLQGLGFDLVGCYDCGVMATNTRSCVAYLCNPMTNDFANVSAVQAPNKTASYFEFSTRFGMNTFLDTNTNRVLPFTPPARGIRTFRFPEIADPFYLYQIHRRLVEKYGVGLRAEGEPKGEEIQRLVRVIEGYGPRHARMGYMYLAQDQESYRLTWKGAFLMTMRALWPAPPIRRFIQKQAMQAELRSLNSPTVPWRQEVEPSREKREIIVS
jgi:hypothetical protein